MSKRINPEAISADNPEWTEAMFAKAKRGTAHAKRGAGRPKSETTKVQKTLRLSPEVLAYFQSTGKGWQTRIDEALKEYVISHK